MVGKIDTDMKDPFSRYRLRVKNEINPQHCFQIFDREEKYDFVEKIRIYAFALSVFTFFLYVL